MLQKCSTFFVYLCFKNRNYGTLILKSNSEKDLTFLLNIAKEKGLILEVLPKTGLEKSTTSKSKISKQKLIMQLSKEVNKEMHKKLIEQYNHYNDSNYR